MSKSPTYSRIMEEYELDYDVQQVKLSDDHVFRVTTMANEALPLEMLLELHERTQEISGQRLWEGSLLLCAYLVRECEQRATAALTEGDKRMSRSGLDLRGKAVLELGAGTGVVSMLAHSLGASSVVMTDGDAKCVTMAQRNLEENNIASDQALVATLRWGEEESTADFCGVFREWEAGRSTQDTETEKGVSNERVAEINGQRQNVSRGECGTPPGTSALTPLSHFDFLLAGDVLYKHSLLEPFLRTVGDMLAPDGRVFLCHVPRAGVTYDTVEEAFVEAGFRFEVLKGVNSEEREGPNVEKNTLNGVDDTCSDGSAAVGGVELCVDDARRARLYEFWLNR